MRDGHWEVRKKAAGCAPGVCTCLSLWLVGTCIELERRCLCEEEEGGRTTCVVVEESSYLDICFTCLRRAVLYNASRAGHYNILLFYNSVDVKVYMPISAVSCSVFIIPIIAASPPFYRLSPSTPALAHANRASHSLRTLPACTPPSFSPHRTQLHNTSSILTAMPAPGTHEYNLNDFNHYQLSHTRPVSINRNVIPKRTLPYIFISTSLPNPISPLIY